MLGHPNEALSQAGLPRLGCTDVPPTHTADWSPTHCTCLRSHEPLLCAKNILLMSRAMARLGSVALVLLFGAQLGSALYEKGDPVAIVTLRSFDKVEKSTVPVVVVSAFCCFGRARRLHTFPSGWYNLRSRHAAGTSKLLQGVPIAATPLQEADATVPQVLLGLVFCHPPHLPSAGVFCSMVWPLQGAGTCL